MSAPRAPSWSVPPSPAAVRRCSRWQRPTTRPSSRPGGPSGRKAMPARPRNSMPKHSPAASRRRRIDSRCHVDPSNTLIRQRRAHRMIRKFAATMACLLTISGAAAQDQAAVRRQPTYEQQQEKMNAWTVGLAAGLIEGAPLRLAAEMGRVVDDGENLHVLPIVTRGPTENLNSLLYLRGIDLAIINS